MCDILRALLRVWAENPDMPRRGHTASCVPPALWPVQPAETSLCPTPASPTPMAPTFCLSLYSGSLNFCLSSCQESFWSSSGAHMAKKLDAAAPPCPVFPMERDENIPVPHSSTSYHVKCTHLLSKHHYFFFFKLLLPRKHLFAAACLKTSGVHSRGPAGRLHPSRGQIHCLPLISVLQGIEAQHRTPLVGSASRPQPQSMPGAEQSTSQPGWEQVSCFAGEEEKT